MNEKQAFTDRDPKKDLDRNQSIPKKRKPWNKQMEPFSTTKQNSNNDSNNRKNDK